MIEQRLLKLKGDSLLHRWREKQLFNVLLEIFNYYHYDGQSCCFKLASWGYVLSLIYTHVKRVDGCRVGKPSSFHQWTRRRRECQRRICVMGKWRFLHGCNLLTKCHNPSGKDYLFRRGKPEYFQQLTTPFFLIKVGAAGLHHKSNIMVLSVPFGIQSSLPVV